MINSPLENTASIWKPVAWIAKWFQVKPRITQKFGKTEYAVRSDHYGKYGGMIGHNGLDFGVPIGTPVFASFNGKVKVKDQMSGYGLHVRIRRGYHTPIEAVSAHLSKVVVKSGQTVNAGQLIGFTGNTGDSSGPHLHLGLRFLIKEHGDVFKWEVLNYRNGYLGYVDPIENLITFKGGFTKNSLLQEF